MLFEATFHSSGKHPNLVLLLHQRHQRQRVHDGPLMLRCWCYWLLPWTRWFRCNPYRNVGRPVKKWSDDVVAVAGDAWADAAKDQRISSTGFINGYI